MTKPKRGYAGVHPGTPVRVYRNLRPGVPPWSVQAKCRVPGTMNTHNWYVVSHAHALVLDKATFKVYEKGRAHALASGRGYIHSYVLGTVVAQDDALSPMLPEWVGTELKYDYQQYDHFYDVEQPGYPIVSAARVWLTSLGQMFAEGASE